MTPILKSFRRVRLELARSKDFPAGSRHHGYEFVAPLNRAGHIDAELWKVHRDRCRVRRFWGSESEDGWLVRKAGGVDHVHWMFDYDPASTSDDELGYRLGVHVFRNGEYVTMTGHTGEEHTFRVISVEPLA